MMSIPSTIRGKSLKREGQITFATDLSDRAADVIAVLSTESSVPRFFGREVLDHSLDAIDLSRDTGNGFPLLSEHSEFIGRIRDLEVSEGELNGRLEFSDREAAQQVERDIRAGLLDSLSVGYRINEFDETSDGIRVTDWTLLEASVVAVPADPAATVTQRNYEDRTMGDNVTDLDSVRESGAMLENKRQAAIRRVFSDNPYSGESAFEATLSECLADVQCTPERAELKLLRGIKEFAAGMPTFSADHRQGEGHVEAGVDALDKFTEAFSVVYGARANPNDRELSQAARGCEFSGWSLVEMGREHALLNGQRLRAQNDVVDYICRATPAAQGTGSFTSLLENVANKELQTGFENSNETYSAWVTRMPISDFKTSSLLNLSQFPDLSLVAEQGEIEFGLLEDIKETIQLATYAKRVGLSRQAIINDDTSAFTRLPAGAGRAAARLIGDKVYAVLTTNAAMNEDATALFDAATHGNFVDSGLPPDVDGVDAARVAMQTQTDPAGINAAIDPGFLIVPVTQGLTARTLMAATYDPAGTAGTLTPNGVAGTLSVIEERRLDADSTTRWYVAARNHPTVVLGLLNGSEAPFLESRDGWEIDGIEWKVRMDVAAVAGDWRGLYMNDGAA